MAVSRESAQQMPTQIIDAALRLDAGALPAFAGVDLGTQGYAVVKVLKVLPREASNDATARQDRTQYAQWWTAAETLAYYQPAQGTGQDPDQGRQAGAQRARRVPAAADPVNTRL
jgi:membrane protease subunit (stomatin/prohibitin family)